MKRLVAAAFLVFISLPAQAGNFGSVSVDRLVRVYDGDTIYVDIDALPPLIGQNIPVRVRGVDTPEIRGKCIQEKTLAIKVRDYVRAMTSAAERIELIDMDRGSFFRIVATVKLDGMDLAELLITEGYGKKYSDPDRKKWCNQ